MQLTNLLNKIEMAERDQYVYLSDFRRKNGLLQQDIADYLSVSRGYVSLVEKGASKLSRKNIDKIYDSRDIRKWDISCFIPAYSRICELIRYDAVRNVDAEPRLTLEKIPGIDRVRYGEAGITDFIAEYVKDKVPDVNLEWLSTGKGKMFADEEAHVSKMKPLSIRDLQKRIAVIQKELDVLSSQLKQMEVDENADELALNA